MIDTWAVPVHKVMSLDGRFRSRDLKDYLGLPRDRRLILSTCGPDSFMEMLWEQGEKLDFEAHGIDYWFPAHFSIYDDDCRFLQFFNARRQQIHAARVRSQFVWFRLGEHIPVELLAPVRGAPAVLVSSQQMFSARNREVLRCEIEVAKRWFGRRTRFFIIGGGYLRSLLKGRSVFEVNERWLILGLKGRTMENRPAPGLRTEELLVRNLEAALGRTRVAGPAAPPVATPARH